MMHSILETARILNVTIGTIHNMIEDGRLTAINLNKNGKRAVLRISQDEIDKLIS